MGNGTPVPIETLLAHRGWVRGLARTLVRDEHGAEDLEQQVWVDALRCPPTHGERLRAWFATILRRRARDSWRGETRREAREAAAARPDRARESAAIVAEAEAHRRVVDALMGLEEPSRETLLLRFYEDLPPRDVAKRMGVPVETVRTRTRRALERMRERLDGTHDGGRAAWTVLVAPLGGLRLEAGAAAAAAGGTTTAGAAAAAAGGGAVMGTKVALAAGLAGAVVGTVVTGLATGTLGGEPRSPELSTARAEIRDLQARLAAMEARGGADSEAPAATPAAPAVAERLAAQERRIAEMETILRESGVRPATPEEREARERAEGAIRESTQSPEQREAARAALRDAERREEERERTVAELRRRFLDTSLPEAERTKALTGLRMSLDPGAIDRRVVDAAAEFFRSSAMPGIREVILRDLHGKEEPEVKRLFLEALRDDPEERVRERAARDLDTFLGDPLVRIELERARDGDTSDRVRKQASATLDRKER